MRYRKLDAHGDMVFGHGSKDYYKDQVEAVTQAVLTRLMLWTKEWYLDQEEGTPYQEEILGRGTEASSLRAIQERILNTPGVRRLISFDANQDSQARHATFTIELETDYGEVTINA